MLGPWKWIKPWHISYNAKKKLITGSRKKYYEQNAEGDGSIYKNNDTFSSVQLFKCLRGIKMLYKFLSWSFHSYTFRRKTLTCKNEGGEWDFTNMAWSVSVVDFVWLSPSGASTDCGKSIWLMELDEGGMLRGGPAALKGGA